MAKRCMGCMNLYGEAYDVCPYCGYIEGTPPKEAYHMNPGTFLHGKYIAGRVIGYGGFGVTYIGWDTVLEQRVAIKEYLPSEFATRVTGEEGITIYSGEKEIQFQIGRQKFFDEARRLAQFNGVDGVVEIKDIFQENNTAYIIMEFLEGETLKERIVREGKIEPTEAIAITKEILHTLDKVHEGDIIHRDIAPDNIFLCSSGDVKLLDFGASRYATIQHSKSLSVILKEGYAPEEQYRSKGNQGSWSDVYATGATLYKMLTGVTPEDAMERAEKDKLKPVSKYGVKLSKGIDAALMNAMNVFAEDRTQTANDFIHELEADEVKRKERTRKKIDVGKWPLWSKIAIGCIAAVLSVSGIVLSQGSSYALEEGQAYVPEIINLKDKKAQRTVEKNDLTLKIIGQEKSDKVEAEKVMTQYPDAGRVVNQGELVEAKISAGNAVVMVDLTGMSKKEADELLKTLGFLKVEFKAKESAAPENTVIAQSVKAGEEIDVNETITLTISKGIGEIDESKNTKVPKLKGLIYAEALKRATEAKVYLTKKVVESDEPEGTVLSQSEKAGSSVKQGTTITINVSGGSEKIEVPYVEYLSETEAKELLRAYGLKYSVSHKHSETVKSGLVISQDAGAGKKVKPGTTIELVISAGREKVSVPQTAGQDYQSAANTLVDKGFRYTIVFEHSENTGWGEVISASPGGKQEQGTKITLTVSKGTSGKLVSASEYDANYSDGTKYAASPRYRYSTREKEYTTSGYTSISSDNGNPWSRYDTKTTTKTTNYYYGKSYPKNSESVSSSSKVQKTVVSKGKYYRGYCYKKGNELNYVVATTRPVLENHVNQNIEPLRSSKMYYLYFIGDASGGDRAYGRRSVNVVANEDCRKPVLDGYRDGTVTLYSSQYLGYYAHVYKIKTTETKYCFSRWSNWSDWGEWTEKRSTGDTRREDDQKKYYVVGIEP